MEKTFLSKLNEFIATVFEKIAANRTRQALISLDDRTLADIGYTRQQVLKFKYQYDQFRAIPANCPISLFR